jgi:hypothetical protein
MRRSASWLLAGMAAIALVVAVVLACAQRTVFRADGFGDRVAATLESGPVRQAVARRISDAAIRQEPDLVAVRPLIEAAAQGILRTEAFRELLRGAAADLHRSAFDRDAPTVTLSVADAGILVADALRRVRPDLAGQVPQRFATQLVAVTGGGERTALRVAARAQDVRRAVPIAFAVAALLAIGALAVAPGRRDAALRLGVAVAVAAGLLAVATDLAPRAVGDGAAGRAVLEVWLRPLAAWAWALAAAAAVVAMAAASVVRPVAVGTLVRRGWAVVKAVPRDPRRRAMRAVAAGGLGVACILAPRAAIEAAVAGAGVLLAVWGLSELLALTAAPQPAGRAARERGAGRAPRVAAVALALVVLLGAVGALAASGGPEAPHVGRCNGSAALCDRPLDDVAFAGTHNSMAADREPGWLFAAQDAGIPSQLADGVRALLIDTHYGYATPRGVITDLSGDTKSRGKIVDELGERFVQTAERLRQRIGTRGAAPREVFLCHAFCEVGATRAVDALAGVHRYLVTHPEEVLVLSVEDDTAAADTAEVIERSGLEHEVFRGPARPPWPTLRRLIERDERVLVLTEDSAGAVSWIHRQPEVMQETPYRFRSAAEVEAPASCSPNRGGTAGSLFLVNHWVDTSPAPRPSIAREVNAPAVLDRRLGRCRRDRDLLPSVVAVDFYREGDVFAAVNALNGAR